jgi:NADP-dependent 3-hydroxy acid dehydrogenase YdfG
MPGTAAGGEQPVVLVVGATGGVGKRVVARLLARGCRVRALVRDLDKARELLGGLPAGPGGSLELAAADLTQRATLLPEMVRGVRSVVCCSAVKVAPKEGDTVDRQKYMQGIKFFDPEIVGECSGVVSVPCSGRRQGQAAAGAGAALLA